MIIELVKVKTDDPANEQGFYLLEKQDFNAEKHTLWSPAPKAPPAPPPAAPTPPPAGKK